jgi:hypothetical protein
MKSRIRFGLAILSMLLTVSLTACGDDGDGGNTPAPLLPIERVSVDSAGVEANGYSSYPSMSADGKYVAFSSSASNLVADDTNAQGDIFLAPNK